MDRLDRFFDVGVVDADNDGNLDIYTSNHHFRQLLLLSDGKGNYHDVLSKWGLDQDLHFPNAELSFTAPKVDRPGLYIYWLGTQFVIQTHEGKDLGPINGTLHAYDVLDKLVKKEGFDIRIDSQEVKTRFGSAPETTLHFSTKNGGYLRFRLSGQGAPLEFTIEGNLQPDQIFVGLGKISPASKTFSLTMLDRHALVWADYNKDGSKDIFINRGALGGTLRLKTEKIRQLIHDELLVRQPDGRFLDVSSKVGLEKRDCSGRHARWIDINNDGLLDLFNNCFDRKHSVGDFPKQLYVQQPDGRFREMAEESGLAVPEQQIGSLAWFDVDNDGDIDLVTLQNRGFFLYRNNRGKMTEETIYERPLKGVQIGSSTEGSWVYDGKISVADFDLDGDIDLFSSSKRGNVLLVNDGGHFRHLDPASMGLPEVSLNASWVDYDNDGYPDLHAVPQGLFKSEQARQFKETGVLRFPDEQYQGAVTNWFDEDNDGQIDVMMTLNANPDYHPWWRKVRIPLLPTTWLIEAYRNTGTANHWLQIELVGSKGNHEAIGAQVTVHTREGDQVQVVGASNEGAFFSQGHYRLYFGLGNENRVERIDIRWPDGKLQSLKDVEGDRLLTIEYSHS